MSVSENLQFVLRKTGRTRKITPEFGKTYELPEVELVSRLPVGELKGFDDVAEVEGEGFFYLHESPYEYDSGKAAVLLCRQANAFDAGDNIQRTRTAPQSTQGISAPLFPRGGSQVLSKIFGEPSFAAPPGEYTGRLEA